MLLRSIIIVLFLALFPGYNTKAQEVTCPPGHELHVFNMTVWCGGYPCTLKVYICCYWDRVNDVIQIYWKRIEFPNLYYLGAEWYCYYCIAVFQWEYYRGLIEDMIAQKACTENWCGFQEIPPCDPPVPFRIDFFYSQCYYWENKDAALNDWVVIFRPCDDERYTCIHKRQICKTLPECRIYVMNDEWIVLEPANCSIGDPQIPPPGKTWEEYWRTDCFAKPCTP